MGRPAKWEPRTKQFNLSLTASELESIRVRAESVGMRPVHFGRAVLLDERRRPAARDGVENNAPKLVYAQLIRLGNNLNQLVRHLHRHGGPLPHDLEPLLLDVRELITKGIER